jgi:hypothetical protein
LKAGAAIWLAAEAAWLVRRGQCGPLWQLRAFPGAALVLSQGETAEIVGQISHADLHLRRQFPNGFADSKTKDSWICRRAERLRQGNAMALALAQVEDRPLQDLATGFEILGPCGPKSDVHRPPHSGTSTHRILDLHAGEYKHR